MVDEAKRTGTPKPTESGPADSIQAHRMEAIVGFAGGITHEFNNILTPLVGCCRMALKEAREGSPLHDNLKDIEKAAERAIAFIAQIRRLTRKTAAAVSSNMNEEIEGLSGPLREIAGEHVTLDIDLEPAPVAVRAVPGGIEQILRILTLRAADVLPQGGRIALRTKKVLLDETTRRMIPGASPGTFMQLTVSDNGPEVDASSLPFIFEPFAGAEAARKGLGLSLVYAVVRQCGGWITAESSPRNGTTFTILLPADERKTAEGPREADPGPGVPGRGERVLVVEDHDIVRTYTSKALRTYGYAVFEAVDSRQALDIFEREHGAFALIFSDVVLPGIDGIQLVDRLLSIKPGIPVLITSGQVDPHALWPILQERKYRFLPKPYSIDDMLAAVRMSIDTPEDKPEGT